MEFLVGKIYKVTFPKTNDPYSSISLSNFAKPINKSDNYNIDIQLNKINKEEKKVDKVEKKENSNKKEKFFDDLQKLERNG